MQVELLIVGQGLSGTWLSYYLEKANKSFLVVDNCQPNSPSSVSAGIINPVTGRRIVKTWMIDELLAHLLPAYQQLGDDLGIKALTQKNIVDFHPTPQMKIAFDGRLKDDGSFLEKPDDENIFEKYFNYEFGFGIVNPCYMVNLQEIIPAWRKKLAANNQLLDENFEIKELRQTDQVIQYKNIKAEKIIFCEGAAAVHNPYFKNLPFSLNKGEALIFESTDIPEDHLFKKGMLIAPLGDNLYWIGSNYLWNFPDDQPTEQFRLQAELLLKNWLKVPFRILAHKAAIRPANIERRPYVGFQPAHNRIGILNGLGTKGCSLAPFFAKQLSENLIDKKEILPEADIKRFSKILLR
jgi:glycine/D-amino acid oxidase-like deaminating enzyme